MRLYHDSILQRKVCGIQTAVLNKHGQQIWYFWDADFWQQIWDCGRFLGTATHSIKLVSQWIEASTLTFRNTDTTLPDQSWWAFTTLYTWGIASGICITDEVTAGTRTGTRTITENSSTGTLWVYGDFKQTRLNNAYYFLLYGLCAIFILSYV